MSKVRQGSVGVALGLILAFACRDTAGSPVEGTGIQRVELTPATLQLVVSESQPLTATAFRGDGDPVPGATFTWASDDESVATVGSDGTVTAVAPGSATVEATSGGRTGSAQVAVIPAAPTGMVVDLHPQVQYQTLTGWEAHAQIGVPVCRAPSYTIYPNELLDRAVTELGINRIRIEIRSGAENPVDWWGRWSRGEINDDTERANRFQVVNDNNDPNVANPAGFQWSLIDHHVTHTVNPLRQRLAARGERLYVNLTYTDFGTSPFEHSANAAEYAELIVETFRHLQTKYGWVPDAVEMILEPDNTPNWRANTIGAALVAAGDRLKAAGFAPHFIAPSTTSMANALQFFDGLVQQPRVLEYLTDLGYHRYGGVSDATLQAIGARAVQYGVRPGMLEHIGSGYQDLHADLEMGRASSWQQFALAFCTTDNGAQYYRIDDSNPSAPRVILTSRARYLRHYFLYARLGAVRVGAASGDPRLQPLAFRNPNGKFTVVVKTTAGGTFQVRNLPPGTYGIFFTTASQSDVRAADATIGTGASLTATIPAAGVITIHQR